MPQRAREKEFKTYSPGVLLTQLLKPSVQTDQGLHSAGQGLAWAEELAGAAVDEQQLNEVPAAGERGLVEQE